MEFELKKNQEFCLEHFKSETSIHIQMKIEHRGEISP